MDNENTTARENLTGTEAMTVRAREIDFVTRFSRNWDALREVLGVMRPIRKQPGTTLTGYRATMTLEDGDVGEGELIPYSRAEVTPVTTAALTLEKYAKAVSVEAVNQYGADVAVRKTDEAFLNELQGRVLDRFYALIATGTLTGTEDSFQMAVAMACGKVVDKFRRMRRDASRVVVFVNTLDAYRYLGAAEITVQNAFGMQYLTGFMGADAVVLTPEIEAGKVIAVPSDNIVLYYADPGDAEFRRLGLSYTVEGETNLIGFHASGNYQNAVGECFALMGMALWADYLDAVAVISFGNAG